MKQAECSRTSGSAACSSVAQHDGQRLLILVVHAVGDDPAGAETRGQIGLGQAIDELLAAAAVADQLLDGDDLQAELLGQLVELFAAGAVAVGIEDFAEHAGGPQAGHAGQIDRGLGMAGAAQHAPFLGNQRGDVARPHEIGGLAGRVDDGLDRGRPLLGRDARVARAMVHGDGEGGAQRGRVLIDHGGQFEPLADLGQDRHAELPRPWVIMKLTMAGVTFSAAQMKSPSFSRSSASMTMTISPRPIASTAASIVESRWDTRRSVARFLRYGKDELSETVPPPPLIINDGPTLAMAETRRHTSSRFPARAHSL